MRKNDTTWFIIVAATLICLASASHRSSWFAIGACVFNLCAAVISLIAQKYRLTKGQMVGDSSADHPSQDGATTPTRLAVARITGLIALAIGLITVFPFTLPPAFNLGLGITGFACGAFSLFAVLTTRK